MQRWMVSLAVAGSVLGLGCSPKQYVIRQAADALTGTSDSTLFTGDDDPELVRDSLPVALKGMEALVQSQPDHVGLHASLASGFTTYGYAFVQQEADMAESKSLATAQAGWGPRQEAVPACQPLRHGRPGAQTSGLWKGLQGRPHQGREDAGQG